MGELPAVLRVEGAGSGRWVVAHPDKDPEGRDVVFSGQILAQMIMASNAAAEGDAGANAAGAGDAGPGDARPGDKEVKSIHAVFARAGRYSAGPVELAVDPMHAGRAWASDTVTAVQGDRLLARGLVLRNAVEPDLMRHTPPMPDVPGPEACSPTEIGVVFPGTEVRIVEAPASRTSAGPPILHVWVRSPGAPDSVAASQAIVAWSQPGLAIGAAMRPHADTIDVGQSHRTISTGVISHTAHFHEHADAADWLLFVHEGAYAGHGRVFGSGAVFTRDGALVSTFAQDSMARAVEGPLDWKRAM